VVELGEFVADAEPFAGGAGFDVERVGDPLRARRRGIEGPFAATVAVVSLGSAMSAY
jgi:hypothetical protein